MPSVNTEQILREAVAGYGTTNKAVEQGVLAERYTGRARQLGTVESALGKIDEQEMLRLHPELQEGFDNEIAAGGDPNLWLEAAVRNSSTIDPASVPRSGGIVDAVGVLSGKLGGVESAANTAARAAGAADVTKLSPALAAAYRANNSELFGALGKAGGMVDSGDPYAAYRASVLGQQAVGPAATQGYGASLAASQGYGATNAASQGYGATNATSQGYTSRGATSQGYESTDATSQGYAAQQAAMREYAASQAASQGYTAANARAVEEANAQMVRQGLLGQSLYGQALAAGPSGAAQTLQQRAQQLAGSTGQLSQEELRSVQQGSREAFAARGLEMSNPAISGEIGARIAAQRARQAEDLQMAAGLNQAYTQDLTANRGFATGLYGQDVSLQSQNQGAALQAALAKQQSGITLSLADQQALNSASQFGSNAANEQARFNAQSLNAAGQFNAGAFNTQAAINAQAVNAASQFGASAANQASLYNAQAANAASQFGASAANQASLQNSQLGSAASQFGASAANQASLYNAQLGSAASQFGATAANQASQYNAGSINQASQFSANAANEQARYNQSLAAQQQQQGIANLGLLGQSTLGQTESNRNYQMGVAGGYQNAAYDPSSLVLGQRSNAMQNASGVYNAALGVNPDFAGQLGLNTGVAQDVNMTTYNAQMDAIKAAANNRAAITAAGINAVGNIAGSSVKAKTIFLCIPNGQEIDTPNGSTLIQDIEPGDYVIGFNGNATVVLQVHRYKEDPSAVRFVNINLDSGKTISVCDRHRVDGIPAGLLVDGNNVGNHNIVSTSIYGGVEKSYDILTEDEGYQMSGVPVNSMINEMAIHIAKDNYI